MRVICIIGLLIWAGGILVHASGFSSSSNVSPHLHSDSGIVLLPGDKELNPDSGRAHLWIDSSKIYLQRAKWSKAVNLAAQAIELFKHQKDTTGLAQGLFQMAAIFKAEAHFHELDQNFTLADSAFVKAKTYSTRALHLLPQNSTLAAKAHVNLGVAHYGLFQYDSALAHYHEAMQILQSSQDSTLLPSIYLNLGVIYLYQEDYDSAKTYLQFARSHFMIHRDFNKWANANINLAELYSYMGSSSDAIKYLTQADSLAGLAKNRVQQALIQEFLYQLYKGKGKPAKALQHLENYRQIEDSALSKQFKTEELNFRYQTARQKELLEQQRAETLAKQLALKSAQSNNRLYIIIGSFIIFLLLLALTYLMWRSKTKKIILYKNQKITRQQEVSAEKDRQIALSEAVIQGQDSERQRIADEIHDRLGGIFIAARMWLDLAAKDILVPHSKAYKKAYSLFNQAVEETRIISHNLMPSVLSKLGLIPALRELVDNASTSEKLYIKLYEDDIYPLSKKTEYQIFAIIQEIVNNAIKHSGATSMAVQLKQTPLKLTISVSDNGKGLVDENESSGNGMANIQRRIESINARLKILSQPDKGSTFIITYYNQVHEKAIYNHS